MSWSSEHPKSLDDLPRSFMTQFHDQSWHNDTMPNFRILGTDDLEEQHIILWIDYKDIEDREGENPNRFCVVVNGDVNVFESDNFEELIKFLENDLDYYRITVLQEIANTELEAIGQGEGLGGEYYGTEACINIENMFWSEVAKLENKSTDDYEELLYKATVEERYKHGINILTKAGIAFANGVFMEDPTLENYNAFLVAMHNHFGDKTEDVKMMMLDYMNAEYCDYLWAERN